MKEKKKVYSKEDLYIEIEQKHPDEICEMIRAGVLEELSNDEVRKVCRSLMGLRSQAVIDALAKRSHYFPVEMLDVEICNHNDRDFVSYVLDKYGKKFRYKTPETANRLFEVACKAECTSMLLFLLGKGLAEGQYPRLISGSDKLLKVLGEIRVSGLHPDTVVTFYVEAAVAADCDQRIRELMLLGFPITAVNSEGLNACEVLSRGIAGYDYGKGKNAQIEKQRDLQGLKTLERICREAAGSEK